MASQRCQMMVGMKCTRWVLERGLQCTGRHSSRDTRRCLAGAHQSLDCLFVLLW
jgi:hypothetical protein